MRSPLYAQEAAIDLLAQARNYERSGSAAGGVRAAHHREAAKQLLLSQHIVLPPLGRPFDVIPGTRLPAIPDNAFALPYPRVTMEYRIPLDAPRVPSRRDTGPGMPYDRVVLLLYQQEHEGELIAHQCYSIPSLRRPDCWELLPNYLRLLPTPDRSDFLSVINLVEGQKKLSDAEVHEDWDYDVTVIATYMLMMSCDNISLDRQPLRAKKKLLPPLAKTEYHIIKLPGNAGFDPLLARRYSAAEEVRAQARQHWRRGHIRRLATGKTTWVRSTIVNRDGDHSIVKHYTNA